MRYFFLLCLLCSFSLVWSQTGSGQTEKDRTSQKAQSQIKWLDALEVRVVTEGNVRTHYLKGNVELRQDSTNFFADSSVLKQNLLFAAGNVVIVRGDSLTIFGDTLNYDGNLRYGYLTGETFVEQGGSLLYSEFLEYDAQNNIAYYQRGAVLSDGKFQLTSRRGTYNLNTERILFRDSVEILGEDFYLRTDSLQYDSKTSTAYFIAPTLIKQGDGHIYTEGGHYNLATGDAVFYDNPQYRKEGELARADTMIYSNQGENLLLIDRVFYQKDSMEITSERLFYDIPGDEVTITGNALVTEGERAIRSEVIIYDLEEGRFRTLGRAVVKEEKFEMEADSLFYGENEGEGFAFGRVIWKDTESGMWLESEEAVFSDSTAAIKAYGGRALMVYPSETDSLFLSADTIFSRNFYTATDTHRITQAYYDVKIFRKDFQAVCDSLAHLERDSLFRMMVDPVIWMDTTQLTGDTIDAFLKDGTISSTYIRRNAMVLTSPDSIYFNQMKGREITARFKDGNLNRVYINGNAEALYFPLDETNAYIGINKSECSEIRIDLRDNAVSDIRFYGSPSSSLTPMKKATPDHFHLKGFRWQGERRPRSVDDLKKPISDQEEIPFIQTKLEKAELTAPEPANK